MRYAAIVLTAAVALAGASPALAQGGAKPQGALTNSQLKSYFDGRRIYGTTPSGRSWFIDFKKDGTARGVTRKDGDVGKWWIKGDTMCRNWNAWATRKGKEEACFYIVPLSAKKRVNYVNTNGTLYRSWVTSP